jgi:tetratricopeptide (TPR) repeat protein
MMALLLLGITTGAWAQSGQSSSSGGDSTTPNSGTPAHAADLSPPRSDRVRAGDLGTDVGQSSSKETQVDASAPEDDAKAHPESANAVAAAVAGITPGGVSEFHQWDPHKAAKSVEVGDFYFKRKNYRAAEGRYREALGFKENDAIATYKLAICLEKLGVLDDARAEYESYLKILPYGPEAGEAQRAIERLKKDN